MTKLLERAKFGPEISYDTAAGVGAPVAFSAALTQNPASLIFDNQSNVSVFLSDENFMVNGKTFVAGEVMIYDNRANQTKKNDDFTWPVGTQFYATSAAGVGNFRIAIVYAR